MHLLEAHGTFAVMQDEGRTDDWPPELRRAPTAPLEMTAMAILSGWLDDCQTETDLVEAALHGLSLGDMGVKTVADLDEAVEAVLTALHGHFTAQAN